MSPEPGSVSVRWRCGGVRIERAPQQALSPNPSQREEPRYKTHPSSLFSLLSLLLTLYLLSFLSCSFFLSPFPFLHLWLSSGFLRLWGRSLVRSALLPPSFILPSSCESMLMSGVFYYLSFLFISPMRSPLRLSSLYGFLLLRSFPGIVLWSLLGVSPLSVLFPTLFPPIIFRLRLSLSLGFMLTGGFFAYGLF